MEDGVEIIRHYTFTYNYVPVSNYNNDIDWLYPVLKINVCTVNTERLKCEFVTH